MHYTIPGDSQLLHSSFFIFLPLLLVPPLHFSSYAKNTPKGRVSSWNSRKIKDKGDRERFVIRIYPFLFFLVLSSSFSPPFFFIFYDEILGEEGYRSRKEKENTIIFIFVHRFSTLFLFLYEEQEKRKQEKYKKSKYKERFIIYRIRIRPPL